MAKNPLLECAERAGVPLGDVAFSTQTPDVSRDYHERTVSALLQRQINARGDTGFAIICSERCNPSGAFVRAARLEPGDLAVRSKVDRQRLNPSSTGLYHGRGNSGGVFFVGDPMRGEQQRWSPASTRSASLYRALYS